MTTRTGTCVCGFPVREHFTKRGRKRSCEDLVRLAVINGTMPGDAPPTAVLSRQLRSMTHRPLRLVKSDRRRL